MWVAGLQENAVASWLSAQAAARFTLTTARSLCYFIRAPYEHVGHFGQ
ncbi:hypothetical protein SPIROBIBN47_240062 [uncultured spirochete]|uniref:Uncharacterized protein n=1 Tax=uncultured spirochete TaxID=156406 RepID=A0A3P3XHW1_9SPIR|nr:hypothetical protein SPIROBIBN47_240062 [uncultured spirochete]